MLNRLAPLGALVLLPFVAPFLRGTPPAPIDGKREIASFVPAQSLVYLEACGLDPLLAQGLEHPFVRSLLGSEFGRTLLAASDTTPAGLLARAEERIGRPPLAALRSLTSRGVALGLVPVPGSEKPDFVLVLHGEDPALLRELLGVGFDALEEQYGVPGALDRPHDEARGADLWYLGEDLAIAERQGLLVVSNERDLVRDVLALAADAGGAGMLAVEGFADQHRSRSGAETLLAWADLERLERIEGNELAKLRDIHSNPGALGLLGPGLAGLATARQVTAWLAIEGPEVDLGLHGVGAAPAAALLPRAAGAGGTFARPLALPRTTTDVAQGLVYRDYAAFVRERVTLLPAEALPGFSQALSTFSLFFGGQDFGEDVLPEVSPWIRVVARDLAYDEGREPENPLPGLAVVAELADPQRDGDEWITAFQTLIGILNADRAQKRDGGMMRLSLGLEGEVEITSASFLAPGPGDGVDLRYNLQPACAVAGGSLVLGTHEDLVRSVVRQLVAEDARDAAPPVDRSEQGEHLEIAGAAAARALEQNFETLVMQKVLDEGVTHEEAEEELGGLRLLLASIESARVEVDLGEPLAARLVVRLADTEEKE